ncbi:hypothetical protein GB937_009319 [Aspergillus fischeri]|nr:hypothetical protein GB937_009319 [Aspergillus fischeri]
MACNWALYSSAWATLVTGGTRLGWSRQRQRQQSTTISEPTEICSTNHNKNGIDASFANLRHNQFHHLALTKVDVHVGRRRQLQPGRLFQDHSVENVAMRFFRLDSLQMIYCCTECSP